MNDPLESLKTRHRDAMQAWIQTSKIDQRVPLARVPILGKFIGALARAFSLGRLNSRQFKLNQIALEEADSISLILTSLKTDLRQVQNNNDARFIGLNDKLMRMQPQLSQNLQAIEAHLAALNVAVQNLESYRDQAALEWQKHLTEQRELIDKLIQEGKPANEHLSVLTDAVVRLQKLYESATQRFDTQVAKQQANITETLTPLQQKIAANQQATAETLTQLQEQITTNYQAVTAHLAALNDAAQQLQTKLTDLTTQVQHHDGSFAIIDDLARQLQHQQLQAQTLHIKLLSLQEALASTPDHRQQDQQVYDTER